MNPVLRRLLHAAEWGSALAVAASCGGASDSDSSAVDAATDAVAELDAAPDVPAAIDAAPDAKPPPLLPYPEPTCSGPIYGEDGGFGYHGQCCELALCTQLDAGACPPAHQMVHKLPGYPPGSGSCECSPIHGPYAPHAAAEGPCCYLVGSIGCDGRPLLVAGQPRVAPVVGRADWAGPPRRLA